ncbi:MAG TPA: uracil-DNA glycosylase [archaeon]|nr:uracil-DNA glycosylase [archaeon]
MSTGEELRQEVISFLKQLHQSGEEFVFLDRRREFARVGEPAGAAESRETEFSSRESLEDFKRKISDCRRCRLHLSRTRFVFGAGDPGADLMFVGEGPGGEEDRQGLPFVGASGQLLTKIIAAIGFKRSEIFIANMVKCRPPGNRDPLPDEIETCEEYLLTQIEMIKPKVIVTLGRYSAYYFHGREAALRHLRGIVTDFNGIKVVSTYHPAALLRNPGLKKDTWEDMLLVRKVYDQQGGRPSSGKVYQPGGKR